MGRMAASGGRTPDATSSGGDIRSAWALRFLDIVLAATLLVLVSPAMIVIAVTIMLLDGRPALFLQDREGRRGQAFRLLKFRTMCHDAEAKLAATLQEDAGRSAEWTHYRRLADDPRILGRLGRFLRRSSLDELPQLFNVLSGQMSLVGPRPLTVDAATVLAPAVRGTRQLVRPGVSGLWQVSGRSEHAIADVGPYDVRYVHERSVRLYLRILIATPRAVVSGRGAF